MISATLGNLTNLNEIKKKVKKVVKKRISLLDLGCGDGKQILAQASSLDKELKAINSGNVEAAEKVGELVAKRAIEQGIKKVTFDRSGYKYNGRVKSLADGARSQGLEF